MRKTSIIYILLVAVLSVTLFSCGKHTKNLTKDKTIDKSVINTVDSTEHTTVDSSIHEFVDTSSTYTKEKVDTNIHVPEVNIKDSIDLKESSRKDKILEKYINKDGVEVLVKYDRVKDKIYVDIHKQAQNIPVKIDKETYTKKGVTEKNKTGKGTNTKSSSAKKEERDITTKNKEVEKTHNYNGTTIIIAILIFLIVVFLVWYFFGRKKKRHNDVSV